MYAYMKRTVLKLNAVNSNKSAIDIVCECVILAGGDRIRFIRSNCRIYKNSS